MDTRYLHFLSELSAHNTKQWMDANKDWYRKNRERFLEDVAWMIANISEWEPGFASFQPKDCVFRQNRDVRFSANKDPYKTNFAAYFALGGKKSMGPGYYVHVQPGQSFFAGGIWMPEADSLKKIRQEIDYSGHELREILEATSFKSVFKGIEGEQLKSAPKGFDSEHPYLDLLRFKSFIVSSPLSDKEIEDGSYKEKAVEGFKIMKPFHDFLSRAVEDSETGEGLL
ncbi:DUF2461 domain-containing protein [Mariniradius saccharolyticus]|nr:DUF2461 domain-containing protein [Mariniradius saccharolyticus]